MKPPDMKHETPNTAPQESQSIGTDELMSGNDDNQQRIGSSVESTREFSEHEIQANLRSLAKYEMVCPSLLSDLGKNDIGRRLLRSLRLWQFLGRPDPVFGPASGQRSEWVPKFENFLDSLIVGSELSAERHSSSVSTNEPEQEKQLESLGSSDAAHCTPKTMLSFQLPVHLMESLQHRAALEERTVSGLCRLLLGRALEWTDTEPEITTPTTPELPGIQ